MNDKTDVKSFLEVTHITAQGSFREGCEHLYSSLK